MTSLVARESPATDWMDEQNIFVPLPEPVLDYPDWGDVLTDINKYGGNWPEYIFGKKPNKSPTIGPYPEIGNDDFKQKFEWISKSDLPPEMKERLLGTLAQEVLLPKGKITTPEELGKFLEVTAPHFREALAFQRESMERLARQKAISKLATTAIEGNRNVAIAGLPHKDYVSGYGLTAGVGKPSNIMRTYFG